MRFRDGLRHARGHIVFLLALLTSFAIIIGVQSLAAVEEAEPRLAASADIAAMFAAAGEAPRPSPSPLRADQLAWGRIAWQYFVNNTRPDTGLPGSVDGFYSATAWELGSFFMALVAAQRLQLVDGPHFDSGITRALTSIERLPLYKDALPNKSYDVRTLAMTDYNGKPTTSGIGWSALDVARLLISLEVVRRGYPEHAAQVERIRQRWRLDRLLVNGVMMGLHTTADPDSTDTPLQEGRLGYEEYAAKGLVLAGQDAFVALEVTDTLDFADVEGVRVPVDGRDAKHFGADVCATSEPYVLGGLEFGLDERSRALAWAVLRAQQNRFTRTGIATAVSEDHVPTRPFFLYNCVVGNGAPWAVLSPQGERFDKLRFLDTKAVFGWQALFPTPYTAKLLEQVYPLNNPKRGWYAGRFEADGATNGTLTANANAVLLESLHYRAFGPMLTPTRPVTQ